MMETTTKNEAALYSEKYCFYLFFTGVIFEFHTWTFLFKYVCVIMSVSLCVKSAKIVRYGSKKICQSAAHRNPKNCYQTEEQLK